MVWQTKVAEKPLLFLLFLKIDLNYEASLKQACQKILLKPCHFAFFQLKLSLPVMLKQQM